MSDYDAKYYDSSSSYYEVGMGTIPANTTMDEVAILLKPKLKELGRPSGDIVFVLGDIGKISKSNPDFEVLSDSTKLSYCHKSSLKLSIVCKPKGIANQIKVQWKTVLKSDDKDKVQQLIELLKP